MAGGMLTKQAVSLTAKFLNDVNDSIVGGNIVSLPSGVPAPPSSQTIAGDRIVLDDATALALSDTAIGTLFGGIYQYVQSLLTSTGTPARGQVAFFRTADVGVTYQVTPDQTPTTALPTQVAGIYISAISKGNFGWIQIAGVANVLFHTTLTTTTVGNPVTVNIANTPVAGTGNGDVGAAVTLASTVTILGVNLATATANTIGPVALLRSPFARI
jgi:hypothetical protein